MSCADCTRQRAGAEPEPRASSASPFLCDDAPVFDLSGPAWHFGVPPLELVARSLIVYLLFLVALRLSGKRELGQFTIFDLAAVLLAANALQPAITGPDLSIPGAVVILVTLFGTNKVVALARRRFRLVRRLLDVPATVIARDGAWLEKALAGEDLDDDDLAQALRERGLEDVKEVKLAVLEHDGSISVIPVDGPEVRMRAHSRRYRTRGAHQR
jgi:uncharacterized membrane protein YcaP (DUF421 family)